MKFKIIQRLNIGTCPDRTRKAVQNLLTNIYYYERISTRFRGI